MDSNTSQKFVLQSGATVGYLMDLCEENYRQLQLLAPDLPEMGGCYCSSRPSTQDLHLEILEQSPYTTLVHLTYQFSEKDADSHEPDAILRVYHDARQVEIVALKQDILPVMPQYQPPGLANKWRASQFLSKWLRFCGNQGHKFELNCAPATVQGPS